LPNLLAEEIARGADAMGLTVRARSRPGRGEFGIETPHPKRRDTRLCAWPPAILTGQGSTLEVSSTQDQRLAAATAEVFVEEACVCEHGGLRSSRSSLLSRSFYQQVQLSRLDSSMGCDLAKVRELEDLQRQIRQYRLGSIHRCEH